jgi:MYXO-CTERM domain-containing protein
VRGQGASVRFADLDGDRVNDLYVGQCVSNPVSAIAYGFRDGFARARELWRVPTLPENACGTSFDAVGDFDGDGSIDIVLSLAFSRMYLLDGRTGRTRMEIAAPMSSPFASFTWLMPRQLDDDPAMELIAITNGFVRGALTYGGRRIVAYDQSTAAGEVLRARWEVSASDAERGDLRFDATSVVDLNNDRVPEIVLSALDATTRVWSLTVRDGRDGRLLASAPNAEFLGAENLLGDGQPLILTLDNDRELVARRFSAGALQQLWSVPAVRPVPRVDPSLLPRERATTRVSAMQLDDDPAFELIVAPFDPALPPERRVTTELRALDLSASSATSMGVWRAPEGVTVLSLLEGARLSRPYTQPAVVTSDGYVIALDRSLMVTNRIVGDEFTIPGMRVGGFYSGSSLGLAPLAGAFDAMGRDRAVIARDSRPALVRLDVASSSLAAPPRARWSALGARTAMIADVNGDGTREVVSVIGRDVVALRADTGAERWSSRDAAGPTGSTLVYDILPLRRSDGAVDVFFGRADPGVSYRPTVLRGTDGMVRWNSFTRTVHSGFGPFALGDLTGDGTDDVVAGMNTVTVLNGTNGAVAIDQHGAPYGDPIVAPFSGTETEIYLGGAFVADRLIDRRGAVRGTLANGTFSRPFGAVLRCGDAAALAVTPNSSPEVIALRPQALPTEGAPPAAAFLARATFAGGQRYARPEDVPSNVRRGSFAALTSVRDLDGSGTQSLLAGSTDGWLYALDACTLALRWSMNFHYPVGEAVIADTDGDGDDDVMVSVGDGFLYGLTARTLAAPAMVRDLPPAAAPSAADVDQIETFDSISAAWSAVPGATGYLVRVLTAAGTSIRFPESVFVTGTSAELRELPLRVGGRYRVGVTAQRADGAGEEAVSDGATIVDLTPPLVTIEVSRPSFSPRAGQTVEIVIDAVDRTGLAGLRVDIRDAEGRSVRVLENYDARVRYAARNVRVTWAGVDTLGRTLPDGQYTIMADAVDVGEHMTSTRATVSIGAAPPDAGMMVFNPGGGGGGDGCGCHASSSSRPSVWLSALVALVALRRRQRKTPATGGASRM